VVLFWIEQGVRIFRVDNPHTKAYSFWEWMIGEVKRQFPEVIFLAEAFTRPHVMNRLAKLGFTQSYTYFTWRNTSSELREYMTGLTASELAEYFRPNLWPNTPDILPEYLQIGGRPAFQLRLILAATLGASYGIYGPAFELCVSEALSPGAEEYRNSEKYEVRSWDLEDPEGIRPLISHINRLRKDNPALQSNRNLRFHAVSNENLLAYSKHTDDLSNIIIVVANLDVKHVQAGHLELPAEGLGIEPGQPYQVQDLLTMMRYLWNGTRNYVEINPNVMPAHVFRLRRHLRRERDFDYYL
jgi:starch synthase (maltosyl-transferring)